MSSIEKIVTWRRLLVIGFLLGLILQVESASATTSPPKLVSQVRITGTARTGQQLTITNGRWRPTPSQFGYKWQIHAPGKKWMKVVGANSKTFQLKVGAAGKKVRGCVRARAGSPGHRTRWSRWSCSNESSEIAVPPLTLSFGSTKFSDGVDSQRLVPRTRGGLGRKTYTLEGDLPPGVSFSSTTGVFTGPDASSWNFRAKQIAIGRNYTCALTEKGTVKCWGVGNLGNGSTEPSSVPVDVVVSSVDSEPLSGIVQISSGPSHICAVTTENTVKCWGTGTFGRLGNNSNATSLYPVDVVVSNEDLSPMTGLVQVDAGGYHTCALTIAGGIKCWGSGQFGALGNGQLLDAMTPVSVLQDSDGVGVVGGAIQVTSGTDHTCALIVGGTVKCWGLGDLGQLGDGQFGTEDLHIRDLPVSVVGVGMDPVTEISAGNQHTCALTRSGAVKCWGENTDGQLGDGTTSNQALAVDVIVTSPEPGVFTGAAGLSAGGYHTCVSTIEGNAMCWGSNVAGSLGTGLEELVSSEPTFVVGVDDGVEQLSGIREVASGASNSCAILNSGSVACWGPGNNGQLGNGGLESSSTPVDVVSSGPSPEFSASVAVTVTDGERTATAEVALGVVYPSRIYYHSTNFESGTSLHEIQPQIVEGRGDPSFEFSNPLPDGVTFDSTTGSFTGPLGSDWNFRVIQLAAGSYHTCALTSTHMVKCWGQGGAGQLGYGGDANVVLAPVDVVSSEIDSSPLQDVAQISAGFWHTCAVMIDSSAKCWGWNVNGQLGDGSNTWAYAPVDVVSGVGSSEPLVAVAQIEAGFRNTCAVLSTGGLKCWGLDGSGQLGNGAESTSEQTAPVDVLDTAGSGPLTNVSQVAVGTTHVCARQVDGGALCWGDMNNGQLGNGGLAGFETLPAEVHTSESDSSQLGNIVKIVAGSDHTCALTTEGKVLCWGRTSEGQVGDGIDSLIDTREPRTTPSYVVSSQSDLTALSGVMQIESGSEHTCVVLGTGTAKCWGRSIPSDADPDGRLGNGGSINENAPVDVLQVDSSAGGAIMTGVAAISPGRQISCSVFRHGGVACWGTESTGEFGDGQATSDALTPFVVFEGLVGFPINGTVTMKDEIGNSNAWPIAIDAW